MSARIGVIGSSGGAALAAAADCLQRAGRATAFMVVTDRDCGLLDWARRHGHLHARLEYGSAESFSERALRHLRDGGVRRVLLFYTRRVAAPLIDALDVCNIHPSLLPAFPGLGAVKAAVSAGVRVIGASLHRVDSGLDTGPILAQVATALPDDRGLASAEKISYLQKVWLTLLWLEADDVGAPPPGDVRARPGSVAAAPALRGPRLRAAFDELQRGEGWRVVDL